MAKGGEIVRCIGLTWARAMSHVVGGNAFEAICSFANRRDNPFAATACTW